MVDRVAKLIDEGKLVVAGARPGVVTRTLSYLEISNVLDAIIADIHKSTPELFINDQWLAFWPTYLKMYLFGHVLNFLYRHQSLTVYTGGPVLPSCVGMYVPRALLLWLGHLAPYEEGGAQGVVNFTLTAMPSTGTSASLTVGSPVVTNISLSNYLVPVFIMEQALYYEFIRYTTAISAVDLPSFWTTYSADVSAKLQASKYPCVAVPEGVGRAPDASAWAHPYNLSTSATAPSSSTNLTCVFDKWHSEVAMLFLDWNTSYLLQPSSVIRTLPRPNGAYAMNNSGIVEQSDACRVFLENFCFIARSTSLAPFEPISDITWCGERLSTLNICMFPVQRFSREFLLARICQAYFKQSPSSSFVTSDEWWDCALLVHKLVEFRRVQMSNPRWEVQLQNAVVHGAGVFPAPSMYLNAKLPLLLAQLANEIGPVVHHGQLRCPFIESMGSGWWDVFATTATSPNRFQWMQCVVTGIPAVNTFKVNDAIVLNAAWRAGYSALASVVWTPLYCWERLVAVFNDGIVDGSGYGRGETTWPVSNNPRGGLSMLNQVNYSSTIVFDVPLEFGGRTGVKVPSAPQVTGFRAASLVQPVDQACWELGLYSRSPANTFGNAISDLRQSKYYKIYPEGWTFPIYAEEAVTETTTFGGSINMLLADAIKARHKGGSHIGFLSGEDDVDACLLDALRGVLHTIARSSENVIPALAGAACSVIGPIGTAACSTGASILTQKVIDLTTDKSNRQSMSKKEALVALKKEANVILGHKQPGDPVLVGKDWGKKAIYEGLAGLEKGYRMKRLDRNKAERERLRKAIDREAARAVSKAGAAVKPKGPPPPPKKQLRKRKKKAPATQKAA